MSFLSSLEEQIKKSSGNGDGVEDEDEDDDDFVPEYDSEDADEENKLKETEVNEKSNEKHKSSFDALSFFNQMKNNSQTAKAAAPQKTEKIVKEVYDFAGEQVIVEKKVLVDEEKPRNSEKTESTDSSSKQTSLSSEDLKRIFTNSATPKTAQEKPDKADKADENNNISEQKTKRPASSVLDSILNPKKRKINTLDKTKLDWESFVEKEKIGAELEQKRKSSDSYLGKVAFMNRTDQRLFEQERQMRMQNIKK